VIVKTLTALLLFFGCFSNQIQAETNPPSYCPNAFVSAAGSKPDEILHSKIAQLQATRSTSDLEQLREFYEACGYAPIWVRDGQVTPSAKAVLQEIQSAAERGLDPNDYSYSLEAPSEPMTMTEDSINLYTKFELNLSLGALLLARDLRCGRIAPKRLHAGLPAPCEGFIPGEFVWKLSRTTNPSLAFDSLEPAAPGFIRTKEALHRYLALSRGPQTVLPRLHGAVKSQQLLFDPAAIRAILTETGDLAPANPITGTPSDEAFVLATRSFQTRHGLPAEGAITVESYKALAVPMQNRVAQLGLTLERWRWVQRTFSEPPIVVNIPEFRVRAYDTNLRVALSMKVIVGGAYHRRTPVFQNQISSVIFRPYWNIPTRIQHNEVEPAMRRDHAYLAKHGYEIVRTGDGKMRIRQRPGDQNALGLIKFSLPNIHDVYLHGTPAQNLFDRTRRDFSHGCIRVENPVALAAWILRDNPGWTAEKIKYAMHGNQTFSVTVPHPIPVLIVYGTGFAAEDNTVYFLPDIYNQDAELEALLHTLSRTRRQQSEILSGSVRR
jgi:murein L,D-transpeptidase YcbB/YkuD